MAGALASPVDIAPPESVQTPAEIRSARPEELRQAWDLQRAAFDLTEPAASVHPGARESLRVVLNGGRVVSCLTVIHAELSLRGASVPMGGVRHVATHPDEQNRGYATALMRDTLRDLREQGLVTSVLFPFSFRYYRKFGYELGGNHCQFWCRPNCIPAYLEGSLCRPATRADVPHLARFYARRCQEGACSMGRSEARWETLCADASLQVRVGRAPDLAGYAVTSEGRDSYGGRVLRVLELAAGSPTGWRALLGCLAQAPVESIEWLCSASDLHASGLMRTPAPLREGFKPRGIVTVRPMFQFRVVDLVGALRARRGAFPTGDYGLALRVQDDLLPRNADPVTIQSVGGRVSIRRSRPGDEYLELDIRIFSQLYCGYMSAAEALSQGLARASGSDAEAVAEALFPAGEPFISELDRF